MSWHLGYPHGGGYKVDLVCPTTVSCHFQKDKCGEFWCFTWSSKSQNETFQLLPEDPATEWQTEDARFKQSHQLTLPQGSFAQYIVVDWYVVQISSISWSFQCVVLTVRVSKLSEGVTCDDFYYSSVQPVVVGVFFLLSWPFQRCRAFRSDIIVGRSDLRRLLHASAASSHRVGKEVQVQVFRSSKLWFGFFFIFAFLYLFFILYLARSCADLKIVADENTEEGKKIRHIKVENYEWKTQNKMSGDFAFRKWRKRIKAEQGVRWPWR